jgi:prolipoprotein diacylglyceryltransferase
MSDTLVHGLFDILAWVAAGAAGLWLARVKHVAFPPAPALSLRYAAAALLGAGVGAGVFGTANLWLSGLAGVGRSIEGALAGGILAVEIYKRHAGITARTGARFALPVAVGIAIGRIGCFLAGLDDFTYGTPTALPWGHDFGDGIPRHPVQLYEAAALTAAALLYVRAVLRHDDFVIATASIWWSGFMGCSASPGNSSNPMAH